MDSSHVAVFNVWLLIMQLYQQQNANWDDPKHCATPCALGSISLVGRNSVLFLVVGHPPLQFGKGGSSHLMATTPPPRPLKRGPLPLMNCFEMGWLQWTPEKFFATNAIAL